MLLSAKNKRMFWKVLGYFGAAVLALIFFRSFKDPEADGVGEKITNVKDEITDLFKISMLVGLTFATDLILNHFGLMDAAPGVSMAVAIGTLTTGAAVVTTFNTTYVPKYFFYAAATQLTGVKITVQGDGVIFDSDAPGLSSAGVARIQGQVTNGYFFTLANGFIPGKNVIWEFTNSAAQTPIVFVSSDEAPAMGQPLYLQYLRQAILANSGQNFEKLATIALPSLSATDIVNILYADGTQQQLNRADIQAQLSLVQNVVNTPVYSIDNFAGRVKTVNVLAGIAQTAYIQRWVAAIGNQMLNQVVNN